MSDRQFKCNFCERLIPYRLFGQETITCYCGAKYTKQVTVQITRKD